MIIEYDLDRSELHQKVLIFLEEVLEQHKMLERITKKSVKLRQHRADIAFMERTIRDSKDEYAAMQKELSK